MTKPKKQVPAMGDEAKKASERALEKLRGPSNEPRGEYGHDDPWSGDDLGGDFDDDEM